MEIKQSIKEPRGFGDFVTIVLFIVFAWFILSLL